MPAGDPPANAVALEPSEQHGSCDVGRLTLASSQPGTIQAGWEAPIRVPTDYRVAWAKVGEGIKRWTDLSGNAFPAEPSKTITGLEEGEDIQGEGARPIQR